jgi:hypothetical protein
MGLRGLMTSRAVWVLIAAPVLAIGTTAMGAATQAATGSPAAGSPAAAAGTVVPNHVNNLDCNGYSSAYQALSPSGKMRCTDPRGVASDQYSATTAAVQPGRFEDNGHYIGHDEPSVKFISHKPGSGNTMTYVMRLPRDPRKAPTPSGSVTDYSELSIAPWFGLPLCDPGSYPENPCTPDSDTNSGAISDPNAAGSAFMELQFYPPGFAPFTDNVSCTRSQWCAAMTIDSLEAQFNFVNLNPACTEPVNFAFLQRNGVPAGPPSPQLANLATNTPNAQTLKMNAGDTLVVSISDPASGFTTRVNDLSTGQSGVMTASAQNGFTSTNFQTCAGTPFTFHAEYSTASQQNPVPWASLEGGVLMQQEIGHFESCNSVSSQLPFTADNGAFSDPQVFQTCNGGAGGPAATGEGPCSPTTGLCQNATAEGPSGPVACPTNDSASGATCEFSDANCFPAGNRPVTMNGTVVEEHAPVAGCLQNIFQNGNVDFDGTSYTASAWPDGTRNHPTSFEYIGPFTSSGASYPQVQFETDVPQSESLCDLSTGAGCQVKPIGSSFYPFWSLNSSQRILPFGIPACVWNFGNILPGVTTQTFGGDAQYGSPDLARFGGTAASPVVANPAVTGRCPALSLR